MNAVINALRDRLFLVRRERIRNESLARQLRQEADAYDADNQKFLQEENELETELIRLGYAAVENMSAVE